MRVSIRHHRPEVVINLVTKSVTINGEPIVLRQREFRCLEHLALCEGTMVTREYILLSLYGKLRPNIRAVDFVIHHLRKKLAEQSGGHSYISAVRYLGFVMRGVRLEWTSRTDAPAPVTLVA